MQYRLRSFCVDGCESFRNIPEWIDVRKSSDSSPIGKIDLPRCTPRRRGRRRTPSTHHQATPPLAGVFAGPASCSAAGGQRQGHGLHDRGGGCGPRHRHLRGAGRGVRPRGRAVVAEQLTVPNGATHQIIITIRIVDMDVEVRSKPHALLHTDCTDCAMLLCQAKYM